MAAKPQFSLRLLFVMISAVALVAAEAVAFPGWLALIVGLLLTSFLPPVFAAGIVYARGYGRAFCIGALAWLVAASWIAHVSLGIPGTFPIKGPELVPGMGGGWQGGGIVPGMRGYLAIFRSPFYSAFGDMYRLDYCVLWVLTFTGGLFAVVVRWLTLGKSPRESE